MTKPSLYQRLLAAGVTMANHYSDLYFAVTEQTTKIVDECIADGILTRRPPVFINQVEGGQWYDAAFLFEPYWDRVRPKAAA